MSIARCCPYSDEKENCKYEIYSGQPKFEKCPTCDRKKKADEKPDLKKENEELKARVSYLEDNLRVARKDRERLQEDVAKGIEEFIKEKPATSLHLLANKELREELEKLKKENEQLKIENVKMRCCGNCTHRNAEEVVETCKLLKKYTQVKGACDKWSFAEDRENGLVLHNLKENPKDLPTRCGEYLTNIGVLDFDNALGNRWHTPLCEACDYYEDVTDEVTVWCELPKLEV